MRKFILISIAVVAAIGPVQQGRAQSVADLQAPLPADAKKRTWDFMRIFDVPELPPFDSNNCTGYDADFKQYIAAYRDRLDRFLKGPTDSAKMQIEFKRRERKFSRFGRFPEAFLKQYERLGKTKIYMGDKANIAGRICDGKHLSYRLQAIREGLTAFKKLYPSADTAATLVKVEAAIIQIGDDSKIASHIGGNIEAQLEAVRMKPARGANPAWRTAFRKHFAQKYPKRIILKQNLRSRQWDVERHALSGRPLSRAISSQIASRLPDGKCHLTTLVWRQNHNGGGFGASRFDTSVGGEEEILCKNI